MFETYKKLNKIGYPSLESGSPVVGSQSLTTNLSVGEMDPIHSATSSGVETMT